ncbi:MAG: VCBS repeat-containing protein, partial [Myxococcota bacterium]
MRFFVLAAVVLTPSLAEGQTFADVGVAAGTALGSGTREGGIGWGDLNEDGCLDQVVNTATSSYWSRILIQGASGVSCTGTFADQTATLAANLQDERGGRTIIVADVSNDGYPDLVRNHWTVVEIYLNRGPTFGYAFGTAAGDPTQEFSGTLPGYSGNLNTEGISALDFDDDGDLDLVVDSGNRGIIAFRNDGTGTFTSLTP